MPSKMSFHGRLLLTQWHGRRNSVHHDSSGLLTVGVCHLLTAVERAGNFVYVNGGRVPLTRLLSDTEVDDLLIQDLAKFETGVDLAVRVTLTQNQYDALVSFCFNVGMTVFLNSSLIRRLNQGDYKCVPLELTRFVNSGGIKQPKLAALRTNEIKLWLGMI